MYVTEVGHWNTFKHNNLAELLSQLTELRVGINAKHDQIIDFHLKYFSDDDERLHAFED